jgi:rhodanese-related sulfurtransferase
MSRIVIDVRSPAEYAARHVDGALNIDIRGASFYPMLDELPKTAEYVVYCGAGRRAGQARERMLAAGFTDVTSYGILGAAAVTGLPIVPA